MLLTKSELTAALQHEVHILLHLATKIDRTKLDYRPTTKQRSTLELLQYLSMMGPVIVDMVKAGRFDAEAWTVEEEKAKSRDLDQTLAVIAAQREGYARQLADVSDEDLRSEIEMFGNRASRGYFLVTMVLSGFAAYRTQLFVYLKACGREELSTMNLWAGVDPVAV